MGQSDPRRENRVELGHGDFMDLELTGKVVFIAGGTKGIGLACAKAFAQEGARVAIAGRSAESMDAAVRVLDAQGFTVHGECVDLRDIQSLKATVARVEAAIGPVDILVNSAGASAHHAPSSEDHGRWAAGMQDKYFPAIHAMEVIVPGMAARGSGVVVNIAGLGGRVPDPMHMSGGAANAALMLASAAMAKAWGPRGVRFNTVNPGPTETERAVNSLRVKAEATGRSVEELKSERMASFPLQRYGKPDEVAAMVVFLASARAAYVTGATIAVDGGASALP